MPEKPSCKSFDSHQPENVSTDFYRKLANASGFTWISKNYMNSMIL